MKLLNVQGARFLMKVRKTFQIYGIMPESGGHDFSRRLLGWAGKELPVTIGHGLPDVAGTRKRIENVGIR